MAHTVAIVDGKAPSGGVGGVSAADFMNLAVNFLSAGIVATGDYKIDPQGTPNMTVKVNTGKAYVFNAALSMAYQTYLDASVNATIGSNASGNPRIDAVVLKVDVGVTPNNLANNVASIVVVAGTPAASPSAPSDATIQSSIGSSNAFLRLANVTVANGAASITSGNISDTRVRTALSVAALNVGSDAQGDIYYRNASGLFTRLPAGTSGQFLKTQGAGANPVWASNAAGTFVSGRTDVGSDFTTTATSLTDVTGGSVSIVVAATSNVLVTATIKAQNDTDSAYYTLGLKRDSTTLISGTNDPGHSATGDFKTITYLDTAVAAGTYAYKLAAAAQSGKTTRILAGATISAVVLPT